MLLYLTQNETKIENISYSAGNNKTKTTKNIERKCQSIIKPKKKKQKKKKKKNNKNKNNIT